jgi:flavin-dependent dehydrogenase
MADSAEVAVVGGGPAGAAVAARIASAGRDVVLLERSPVWRWRACGVFSSPATIAELLRLGVTRPDVAAVSRSIPRLWVEAPGGARFALTYGNEAPDAPTAVGFDRSRLDPLLLELAAGAGVRVCRGVVLVGLRRASDRGWLLRVRDGSGERDVRARIVVGADGVRSRVARELGVARSTLLPRVGLTYHVPERDHAVGVGNQPRDGRMVVLPGAYCGLAPVPGARINVGIVLAGGDRRTALRTAGARASVDAVLRETGSEDPPPPLEPVAGVAPIAHRVAQRAGTDWLLVGDAAGFLDPFTGEGLHRALVSARLGAAAVERALGGERRALEGYDATMDRRFRSKDVVSWVVQLFVSQPALFDYAAERLARRARLRQRMGLLMGDLVPASGAFDPRFLAALLVP